MPLPAAAAAAGVTGGAQLLGQGINAFAQGQQNKKQRRWQEKMFNWQRDASLADWNMQNQYNSPEAQMQRLQKAGLNPNLVYGNGATTEAGPIRSSEPGSWNPNPVQFDLGSVARNGLSTYYDMQMKDATIQNLKQQNDNMVKQGKLTEAQVLATIANAGKTTSDQKMTDFDLYMKNQLKDFSYEAARLANQKTSADVAYTIAQNVRAERNTDMSLREALSRIRRNESAIKTDETTRRQILTNIDSVLRDIRLKDLDISLKKMGINPSDPAWQRKLGQLISEPQSAFEKLTSPLVDWKHVDSSFQNFKRKKGYK